MGERVVGWLAIGTALACTRAESVPQPTPPAALATSAPAQTERPLAVEPAPEVDPTEHLQLLVTDPAVLAHVERGGFDLSTHAFGVKSQRDVGWTDNASLMGVPGYAAMVETLDRDLANLRQIDPSLGIGMRYAHRAFDPSWLSSRAFHYELVGIVNRMDRQPFTPGTCGEVRFVYRATYDAEVADQSVRSRMPMTVNVVHWLTADGGDCTQHAQRWRFGQLQGVPLAEHLLKSDQLLGSLQSVSRLKSIEVNLQNARWPSTVRPHMAGHAEYLLRVFAPDASGKLVPKSLENTPDASAMARPNALRAEFVQLLSDPEHLAQVDAGTFVLPERFLADRALSVAPHGLARGGNRPFQQILREEDFVDVNLEQYSTFSSAASLIRRLDGLSCAGCHQTHSVAGFHLLGEDPPERQVDALAVAHSAHVSDELERRRRYVRAILLGQTPETLRPSVERMRPGVYAAHCGLSADGPFSQWTCGAGLQCTAIDDQMVGQCLPREPQVGDACETGVLKTVSNSHRDDVQLSSPRVCATGVCEVNGVGFPGGMCSGPCDRTGPNGTCGAIAVLDGFNACIARGEPFETCSRNNTRPGALRRCSDSQACREDYVCARLPNGEGGCMPPYFLFQLRIDGHVIP